MGPGYTGEGEGRKRRGRWIKGEGGGEGKRRRGSVQ